MARKNESAFYDRFPYPDLNWAIRNVADGPNFSHFAKRLKVPWPRQPRILSIACGVYQPTAIALANPKAQIIAVDFSRGALQSSRWLAEKNAVSRRIHFDRFDIEGSRPLPAEGSFDVIVASGVLHALARPTSLREKILPFLHSNTMLSCQVYAKAWIQWKRPVKAWLRRNKIKSPVSFHQILCEGGAPQISRRIEKVYGGIPSVSELNDCFFHYRECGYSLERYRTYFRQIGFDRHVFTKQNWMSIASVMVRS